jgi:hypothetical protein
MSFCPFQSTEDTKVECSRECELYDVTSKRCSIERILTILERIDPT